MIPRDLSRRGTRPAVRVKARRPVTGLRPGELFDLVVAAAILGAVIVAVFWEAFVRGAP